jgi:hypothetical protein
MFLIFQFFIFSHFSVCIPKQKKIEQVHSIYTIHFRVHYVSITHLTRITNM